MSGIVLLLIIALVVWLVVRFFRKRNQRGETSTPTVTEESIPTFQVVALGLQGAGKTLLLASMYHRLRSPTGQSYFLAAGHEDVMQLNHWFSQMADTGSEAGWPLGTAKGESRQFAFTVKTRTTAAIHPILRLQYLEYAGELLTEPQAPGSTVQEELFGHVRQADALLGIIDGNHLRQYMDGSPMGLMRLEQTLDALVPAMIEATCPVDFVITKWDLLTDLHPDESIRLERVRDLLTSNEHFRSLVKIHGTGGGVRLIPTSAVGPGFATVDTTGRIVKVPQGMIRPSRVDVPLSAVVPDLFDQVEGRLDQKTRSALYAEARRRNRMTRKESLASLAVFVGNAAGQVLLAAFGASAATLATNALMDLLLASRAGVAEERQTDLDQDLSQSEQDLEDFTRARRQVMEDMRRKVAVLEDQLPSSRLS